MLAVNISLSLTTVHCCVLSQIERERRPASWKVFSSCSSGDWRVETGGSVSVLMTLHHLHHTRYLMTQESSQLTLTKYYVYNNTKRYKTYFLTG